MIPAGVCVFFFLFFSLKWRNGFLFGCFLAHHLFSMPNFHSLLKSPWRMSWLVEEKSGSSCWTPNPVQVTVYFVGRSWYKLWAAWRFWGVQGEGVFLRNFKDFVWEDWGKEHYVRNMGWMLGRCLPLAILRASLWPFWGPVSEWNCDETNSKVGGDFQRSGIFKGHGGWITW